MKNKALRWVARDLAILSVATGLGGFTLAVAGEREEPPPVHYHGLINDYTPSAAVVKGGPYEMRGRWSLEVNERQGTCQVLSRDEHGDIGLRDCPGHGGQGRPRPHQNTRCSHPSHPHDRRQNQFRLVQLPHFRSAGERRICSDRTGLHHRKRRQHAICQPLDGNHMRARGQRSHVLELHHDDQFTRERPLWHTADPRSGSRMCRTVGARIQGLRRSTARLNTRIGNRPRPRPRAFALAARRRVYATSRTLAGY